jgi:hypothetical protein
MKRLKARRSSGSIVALCLVVLAVTAAAGAAPKPSARFKTPGAPANVAAYRGWIWVAAHRGGELYKINPSTNRIVHTYRKLGDGCGVFGRGASVAFWDCEGGGYLVNVRTGKRRVFSGQALPVAYAGSLWVWPADPNGVLERVDPKTHVVLKRWHGIDFEGPWSLDRGSIWIPGLTTLARVDTGDDTLTIIPLPGAAAWPDPQQVYSVVWRAAITPGAVWVPNPRGIYRVDERTNRARLVPGIRVGTLDEWGNIDIVASGGSLYVRLAGDRVVRIDPKSGAVTARYPATGGGGGIEVAFGSLWVTNFIADTTWRIPLG